MEMTWRPSSFRPHLLTVTEQGRCTLRDCSTGEEVDVFISIRQPYDLYPVTFLCDVAEPRDLGLQFLVLCGRVINSRLQFMTVHEFNTITSFFRHNVDENHPLTPYRFFILEPGMFTTDAASLMSYLTDANIHFTGISCVSCEEPVVQFA